MRFQNLYLGADGRSFLGLRHPERGQADACARALRRYGDRRVGLIKFRPLSKSPLQNGHGSGQNDPATTAP